MVGSLKSGVGVIKIERNQIVCLFLFNVFEDSDKFDKTLPEAAEPSSTIVSLTVDSKS